MRVRSGRFNKLTSSTKFLSLARPVVFVEYAHDAVVGLQINSVIQIHGDLLRGCLRLKRNPNDSDVNGGRQHSRDVYQAQYRKVGLADACCQCAGDGACSKVHGASRSDRWVVVPGL